MARRNWSPVPHTVLRGSARSELYLSQPLDTRGVYLALWVISDSHGRFCAGPNGLRVELGCFTEDLDLHLERLKGLVQLYTVDGQRYGYLIGYEDDLPDTMINRRGDSALPAPPETTDNTDCALTAHSLITDCDLSAQSVSSKLTNSAPERREEKRRTEERGGARAHTHVAQTVPTQAPGSNAPPPFSEDAEMWLKHRVKVAKRHGYAFATMGEAIDVHGEELRRLQSKPGFGDAVRAMLQKPDSKWGKRMSSGIALLRSIVADYVPSDQDGKHRQAHLCDDNMTREQYREVYGAYPGEGTGPSRDVFVDEVVS